MSLAIQPLDTPCTPSSYPSNFFNHTLEQVTNDPSLFPYLQRLQETVICSENQDMVMSIRAEILSNSARADVTDVFRRIVLMRNVIIQNVFDPTSIKDDALLLFEPGKLFLWLLFLSDQTLEKVFIEASHRGDEELVTNILGLAPSNNISINALENAFYELSEKGFTTSIKFFIDFPRFNEINIDTLINAWSKAIEKGHTSVVEVIAASSRFQEISPKALEAAIAIAIFKKNSDIFEWHFERINSSAELRKELCELRKESILTNHTDVSQGPLSYLMASLLVNAVISMDVSFIQLFLTPKPRDNIDPLYLIIAFIEAEKRNNTEILQFLDALPWNEILQTEAKKGHAEFIKVFLHSKKRHELTDKQLGEALCEAVKSGNAESIEAFLMPGYLYRSSFPGSDRRVSYRQIGGYYGLTLVTTGKDKEEEEVMRALFPRLPSYVSLLTEAFRMATEKGDLNEVKVLLQFNEFREIPIEDFLLATQIAAEKGFSTILHALSGCSRWKKLEPLDLINILLKAEKSKKTATVQFFHTLPWDEILQAEAKNGLTAFVKAFLTSEKFNALDGKQISKALCLAAENGHSKTVKAFMVRKVVDKLTLWHPVEAFEAANKKGFTETARVFSAINWKDGLIKAVESRDAETVKAYIPLHQFGISAPLLGRALKLASEVGFAKTVNAFLQSNRLLEISVIDFASAMQIAAEKNHSDILQAFFNSHPHPWRAVLIEIAKNKHVTKDCTQNGRAIVIQTLLSSSQFGISTADVGCALIEAAKNNHPSLVETCVKSPRFKEISSKDFIEAFQWIIENRDLLNCSAFIGTQQMKKMTLPEIGELLFRAAKKGNTSIIQSMGKILMRNVDNDETLEIAKCCLGRALLQSIDNKHTDTAQAIIAHPLFLKIPFKYLQQAISWAASYGLTQIIQAMMKYRLTIDIEWMQDALEEASRHPETEKVLRNGFKFWNVSSLYLRP